MEAWGFEYKTIAFVWDKQKVNPGYYTMSQVEICLVGKKGKIPSPRGIRNERQFLSEMRRKHSQKPDDIRLRIERMFPTQRKLEMFARDTKEGWDRWGNEVESSITIE
jgi:N6-adenosine-specific RNA methylase IME4